MDAAARRFATNFLVTGIEQSVRLFAIHTPLRTLWTTNGAAMRGVLVARASRMERKNTQRNDAMIIRANYTARHVRLPMDKSRTDQEYRRVALWMACISTTSVKTICERVFLRLLSVGVSPSLTADMPPAELRIGRSRHDRGSFDVDWRFGRFSVDGALGAAATAT